MPLSPKQMEYLALAWQCFETEPKIDYEKFHKLAGLASVASARELMRVTKNKLKEEYGALGATMAAANGAGSTPSKKAGTPSKAAASGKKAGTPESRKRGAGKKARAEDGVDDEEGMGESPTKKAKVKKECDVEDGGAETAE